MSKYEVPQIIKMWVREELTIEQVVGQILLHLKELDDRIRALEKRAGIVGGGPDNRPPRQP